MKLLPWRGMIGIDTNVLARYIIQDDAAQTARARELLQTRCTVDTPGFISCIVLSELTWLLRQGYKYAKADVIKVIHRLLSTRQLQVEDEVQAWLALRDYEQGNADYTDYFLAYRNQQQGCTRTVSFDRKATNHSLFERLS